MELLLIKSLGGLIPENEEEAEKLKRFKLGTTIKCKITEMVNAKFRRKWWALAELAYDSWVETAGMPEYKGQRIEPNFDKFRKELTILAGYWHPVVRINGDAMREADSLAWASMNEETFEKLYSATINAVLERIYKSSMSEEKLRNIVNDVMSFT